MTHHLTTAPDPGTGPEVPSEDSARKLASMVLGLLAVLTVMLLAFATPALNSGPEGLPLAVSGPAQGVSGATAVLDQQAPGVFEITHYPSPDEAAEAIRDRDAVGGIAVDGTRVTIQTAAGAGAAYTQLLTGIGPGLEQAGLQVRHQELAPTSAGDPSTVSVATLGLPLVFGGMATAALLTLVYQGPARMRFVAATGLALLGGLVAAGILQFGFDAFDGAYWQISLAISTGILAISASVLGLGALLGRPGIGLGALLMLLVANPLSGLANGPDWLPAPWGELGQFLPVGAAGSLIRSVAFFDGGGALPPVLVLTAWILAGLLLAWLGVARHSASATGASTRSTVAVGASPA